MVLSLTAWRNHIALVRTLFSPRRGAFHRAPSDHSDIAMKIGELDCCSVALLGD